MEFKHYSVMLNESIEALQIKENGIYIDCTLGGGGHSLKILEKLKDGKLIAFDKDQDAIEHSKDKLKAYKDKFYPIRSDFKMALKYLDEMGIEKISGFIMDLGVSSYQLDNGERGFSYINDAPLDMRMDRRESFSAYELVNSYSEEELVDIFFRYGEERFSKNIARNIVLERSKKDIKTTLELAKIIENSYPAKIRWQSGNPCKKVFQAIRIAVNKELEELDNIIYELSLRLEKGGRAVVISFHSLEDRVVKRVFQYLEKDCICPPEQFECNCEKRRDVKIINKKPIIASNLELRENNRSQSAKLRVAERI